MRPIFWGQKFCRVRVPWMRKKNLPSSSGVSHLYTVSPCPLLFMSPVTIPQTLFSIETQMPLQAKNPQDFPIPNLCPCLRFSLNPCLKPCLNLSPYLSLRSSPKLTQNPHSWSCHPVLYPRLGSVECISIDLRMNQNLSPSYVELGLKTPASSFAQWENPNTSGRFHFGG